jgi:hypothetical protein
MSINLTKPLRLRNDGGAQLQIERGGIVKSLTLNASGNVELDGTLIPTALTTATATITGGSINGTTIGATTASTAAFTTASASTSLTTPLVTNAGTLALSATGANVLTASTNGFERMRIDSSGDFLFNSRQAGTGYQFGASSGVEGEGNNTITLYSGRRTVTTGTSRLRLQTAFSVGAAWGRASVVSTSTSSGNADLILETTAANVESERMRITSAGNVGIGTTAPSVPLHVVTSAAVAGRFTGDNASFASPNLILTDTTRGTEFCITGSPFGVELGSFTNHALIMRTNNTERMRITSAGNVGIGTTNPGANLAIDGTNPNVQLGGAYRVYADLLGSITGTTGTVVFSFDGVFTVTRQTAIIRISLQHLVGSNTLANQPGVECTFIALAKSDGTCQISAVTPIIQNAYDVSTDLAFASTGSTTFTMTFTNPISTAAAGAAYKVEIVSGGAGQGGFILTGVTTS